MLIKRFVCGYLNENGYIVYDDDSKEGYIIDPGYRPKLYIDFIEKNGLNILGILLTHNHHDHIGAVRDLLEHLDISSYMHPLDSKEVSKFETEDIRDGDIFRFGKFQFKVLETPGHSPGSVMFMDEDEKIVFTGDTIFSREIGETRFEGGSSFNMAHSLFKIENSWDDSVILYPGHGDKSTMKDIRKFNLEYIDGLKYYHSL